MQVRSCPQPSAAQWAQMAHVLTEAFWRTPLFADFLFRGRKPLARSFLEALLNYGLRVGKVYVAETEEGEIVGCALWSLPDSPELNLRTYLRTGMATRMLSIALRSPAAMARINELIAMLEHYAPDMRCVTLEFLASVRPGAGDLLVRRSMEDFAGETLYVESIVSKNNHAFYPRFGFVPFARTDFHGTDYAFMLRKP